MSKTEIKEISLYRNGCFVKRRGILELKKGKQTVVFENMSPSLDVSTVRLAVSSGAAGSNVQTEMLTPVQKEEAMADVKRKIARLDNSIAIKNSQIEMWNANADFSGKENVSIGDVVNYITSLPAHLEKLYDEIEELNRQKKDFEKQLLEIQKANKCYVVKADIEAKEDGRYQVEIRYYDSNRWWNPVYEIYTSEEDSIMRIRLKAEIGQKTIENWNQVRMTLYTGNPQISGNIPVLYPQYVDFYKEQKLYKTSMARNVAFSAVVGTMAVEDYEADEACEETGVPEEMYDAANGRAQVVQNDTMMEYELEGLWDVTNENRTTADLQENAVECRYHVVCVPKMDEVGYLAAEVKTADIEEILNTNAVVYHKGTYLGNVYINADMSKDTYDISLGRDESIRLKRDQKKKYTSNVLLKGRKKTDYEYEIKVTSTKNKECQVTVKDQIPVSQDKTIVVDKSEASGGKVDDKTGAVDWEMELGAGESRTLNLNYSVTWPKDKSLNI